MTIKIKDREGRVIHTVDADTLVGADLRNADLTRANLTRANLTSAKLASANLASAILIHANLRFADLTHTDLRGADLRGADIDFAALPLWCGGLNFKIDEKQAAQIKYHLHSLCKYSGINPDDINPNDFHRVKSGDVKELNENPHGTETEIQGDKS